MENLSRNETRKIKLVDIYLLSNCTNFIKPKYLKPKCIQDIFNPHALPKAKLKLENE